MTPILGRSEYNWTPRTKSEEHQYLGCSEYNWTPRTCMLLLMLFFFEMPGSLNDLNI